MHKIGFDLNRGHMTSALPKIKINPQKFLPCKIWHESVHWGPFYGTPMEEFAHFAVPLLKIGPLESCGNEFQSTGSHRLTVCTSTDSYYYFSAYTWGQKRNTFPQGSSGSIFKIPKNVISYEPTEPTFEWAKLFCDISLTLVINHRLKLRKIEYLLFWSVILWRSKI